MEVEMTQVSEQYSVSHGTMRPQDLIPSFLDELRLLDSAAYAQMVAGSAVPAYVWEDSDSDWWHSDDAHSVLDSLFDALNECAAEGFYFGSHPGDGSDYGFWKVEE